MAGNSAYASPQHVLILNLESKSATTMKGNRDHLESKSPGKELWPFEIPAVPGRGEDCWDLFVDTNGSKASVRAVSPSTPSQEGQFIGRLNLQQLGFWDRKKRKSGKLAQAYMIKTR